MHLVHRPKPRHADTTVSAALGMQALRLAEVRQSSSSAQSGQPKPLQRHKVLLNALMAAYRTSDGTQLLAQAMLLAARCCFAASALLTASWLLYAGPLHWRIETGYTVHPAVKTIYESKLWGSMLLRDLMFLWFAPAALALSAVVIVASQALLVTTHQDGFKELRMRAVDKWMCRLLPPRRLWQWLCGGITLQDGLVICCWAATNASWFTAAAKYYHHRAAIKAAAKGLASPTGQQVVKAVARSFGATLAPNLTLLFYPVARGSVVLQALGLSYPSAIRYHRWLGYAVLTLVALHGLTYYAVWLSESPATLLAEATEQGSGHNNLLGSIAFVFALALWLTSLETVRRSNYSVFKAVHHVGFWGFLILGVCHKWDLIWGFLPGLVLYGIDGVYRLQQAVLDPASTGSTVQVLHADLSQGGTMCSLVLAVRQYSAAPSGLLWLSVSSLGWRDKWQYHPFEYITVLWPADGYGTNAATAQQALLIHIKAYDRWTKRLLALVAAKGTKISVRVQGPYAAEPLPRKHAVGHCQHVVGHTRRTTDGIVIIAGGNGISAALSVFQELAAAAAGLPCLLVWVSRSADEFELMGPVAMAMARTLQLQLTTKLYFTGTRLPASSSTSYCLPQQQQLPDTQQQQYMATAAACSEHTSLLGHTTRSHSTLTLSSSATADSTAVDAVVDLCDVASADVAAVASGATAVVTSGLCPVVALGSWAGQVTHKMVMHVAVFAGVLGALLAAKYIQDTQTALLGNRWPTAKAGATYVVLLASGTLCTGFAVLWGTLLMWQRQQKCKRNAAYNSLLTKGDSISSGREGRAVLAAAAAVNSQGVLLQQADGTLQLQLPIIKHVSSTTTSDNRSGSTAECAEAVQLLQHAEPIQQQPCPHTDEPFSSIPVEYGRPQLQQVVKSWLVQLQQLSPAHDIMHNSSSSAMGRRQLHCPVYAMGPEKLVASVQQMCDDNNEVLQFVRMTHQL